MLQELQIAAARLHELGIDVVAKRLEEETTLSLWQINKTFRKKPKLAKQLGCKRRKHIPLKIFVKKMYRAANKIRELEQPMTIPALAKMSGVDDRRIRERLRNRSKLRDWLGVVACSNTDSQSD